MKIKRSDLEKLSYDELHQMVRHTQDLKRSNQFKKLDYYLERANLMQLAFHRAEHRIRFVFTGNRGGKSTAGMAELIHRALGTHPFLKLACPRKQAVVLPDFENHAKNIFEPKLNEWAPAGAIKKIDRHQGGAIKRIHWSTGSISDIYSHDQAMIVFEGSDYDDVWFDEPPPEKIWKAMWRGVTDRGGYMWLTGTPLSTPWLFNEFKRIERNDDPLSWYIKGSNKENAKNLGEGDETLGLKRLEDFASQLTEEERSARMDGEFLQMTGIIFKNWSRHDHLIAPFPLPHGWSVIETIDPHPNKPWAVGYIAVAPNGAKILLKCFYVEGVIDDVANAIVLARHQIEMSEGLKLRISRTLIDNASSVPLWQKSNMDPTARRISLREELELMIGPKGAGGPRVEVCPKNVGQKIDFLKRWLNVRERNGKKRPDFFVFDTAENMDSFVWEIEQYSWARFSNRNREELKDKPIKQNDDALDAVMQVALTIGSGDTESTNQVQSLLGGFQGYGGRQAANQTFQTGPNHAGEFG